MALRFYFSEELYANRVQVYLVDEKEDGTRRFAKPMKIEWEDITDHKPRPPTLELNGGESRSFLPALASALAESGYRAESKDGAELKATKYHLEDMRRIALNEPPTISLNEDWHKR